MATAFEGQGPNRDALIVAANTRRVGRCAPAAGCPSPAVARGRTVRAAARPPTAPRPRHHKTTR